MGRIRTIKPEFPQSESMGRVGREARLCFILLFTLADDAGRLRGNSRMLASLLYPYDDDAKKFIDAWLSELHKEGCIIRYDIEGDQYIQINKWLQHQKIDRPSESKIPAFDESTAKPIEPSRVLDDAPAEAPKAKRCKLPPDFYPNETGLEAIARTALNLNAELDAFKNHHTAKGSLMADWQAAWRTWVSNGVKYAKPSKSVKQETFKERDDRLGRERWEAMTGRVHPDNQRNVIDITPTMELLA